MSFVLFADAFDLNDISAKVVSVYHVYIVLQ